MYEASAKHFADSLLNVDYYTSDTTLLDIGSGAGFPGIPIAIFRPDLKITLIDSLNKRIEFLNIVIIKLNLHNVTTIHSRAQEFCTEAKREQFDYCIARAVARLNILSELCLPFVKINGEFVAYKSANAKEELEEAKNALTILGGKVNDIIQYALITQSDKQERNIITIKKDQPTPAQYPRLKNKIEKKPL